MICISVSPTSRKLAKVDILNAARQCDLVELGLDHLIKEPDIRDLIEGVPKPLIISCRRPQDGGHWQGTEEERLTLLRQAIAAGPEWIELEVDIADKVPRFGKTKRLISFTQRDRPLANLDVAFEHAAKSQADAVKFTGPTPTLDTAWPLLAAVTKKRDLPTVGMGLGRAGLTFSLLGRKYGSPWIYAALEKGMESHEGQATVSELDEVYRWRDIAPQTRFVAVAGFGETETMTVRVFNAGFAKLGLNYRCLPLELDQLEKFELMFDTLKINAILPNAGLGSKILSVSPLHEESVKVCQFTDLMLRQADGWNLYNSIWRSALKALEETIGKKSSDERPLEQRNVLLIGATPLARALCYGVQKRKGMVSVTAADDTRAHLLAQMFDVRFVPIANIYDTLSDVVILSEATLEKGRIKQKLNPSYFREHMTILDVTSLPMDSELLAEARSRGSKVVEPSEIYADQLCTQFKAVTGQELPMEAFVEALPVPEDE